MLIVIEGMDRTGKTSLCDRQPRHTRHRYLHFEAPAPDADALEEYVAPLQGYVPGSGDDYWIDRHYLGEAVWPGVYGRPSIMGRRQQRAIEDFLASRGAVCILTRRPIAEIVRECRVLNEPCAGREVAADIAYRNAAHYSRLAWRDYRHGDDVAGMLDDAREMERAANSLMRRVPRTWERLAYPDLG